MLLTDKVDGHFKRNDERFELVELEEIGIPNLSSLCFKYNILELNTAVKPFFLKYLFKKYGYSRLIYFDPDIVVTADLSKLSALCDRYSIIITPHVTAPIEDDREPGEINLLRGGTYNLGFLALRNNQETAEFLDWWGKRVYNNCLVALEQGLFLDQKWIDLVPGLFQNVYILRDPGYNVAYWNLHERRVVKNGHQFTINGQPLYFYHFSGFDPTRIEQVSKHQDRFKIKDLKDLGKLFIHYRDLLYKHGYAETCQWPYTYRAFCNGVMIPNFVRGFYHLLGIKRENFGNPFVVDDKKSFFKWLNSPVKSDQKREMYISNLLLALYEARPDLQRLYPNIFDRDFGDFSLWVRTAGKFEEGLDEAFLVPLLRLDHSESVPMERRRRRNQIFLKIYYSNPFRGLLHLFKVVSGNKFYEYVRKKVRHYLLGYR